MIDYKLKYEKLLEMVGKSGNTFSIELNMNDVFGWGCSESEELDVFDVEEVFKVYEKYGHYALIAYAVLKRDEKETPQSAIKLPKEYYDSLNELKELSKDGTILFEKYYNKKDK